MSLNNYEKDSKTHPQDHLINRHQHEQLAIALSTTEILTKLNITTDNLPQKCQQVLQQLSQFPTTYDPIALALQKSNHLSTSLEEDYEILKLTQKNEELQAKIDRNDRFLKGLRKELECSREALKRRDPNPDNVQEYVRQLKQKVASYEESCEKANAKYKKLGVPEDLTPKQLIALAETLERLRTQEAEVRARADDVTLARKARQTLCALRR